LIIVALQHVFIPTTAINSLFCMSMAETKWNGRETWANTRGLSSTCALRTFGTL